MKKLIIIIIATLALAGCKKGFLDLNPATDANAEGFYKTANDFNVALIGAYEKFTGYPTAYFELNSYRSDELRLDAPTAGTQDRYDIDKFQDNSSNNILLNSWALYYNGINRCNEVIARIPEADFDAKLKSQYLAEAKFIRAFHYYNLVKFWGSVPLILDVISPADALKAKRISANEVLNIMAEDLKSCVVNLPPSYNTTNIGRATAGAASALLARILLEQKKYGEVILALTPVIGKYSLLPKVADVFSVNNKNNDEIIFSIRFNKDIDGAGHGLWLSTNSSTSSLVPPFMLNAYETNDKRKDLLMYQRSGTSNSYLPKKFYDVISPTTKDAGNDWILIRYAEVLLMYAEAMNEIKYESDGLAFKYLNEVRQRATQNSTPLFTNANFPDQESFREAVYNEYQLELPYEGQRWFTLTRTGKAASEILQNEGVTVPTFRLIFPVPQSEVEKIGDPSIFPQNPNYDN